MPETQVQQAGVDREFVDDFVSRWIEAWNSHEPERVLDLMTEDIVYDDSAWPTTMRGHADVREFLEHTWRAFPDLRFEQLGGLLLDPDAPRAAGHWRGFATNSGPIDPPGLAPTGRTMEVHGVDLHEYRDGKLARLTIVFNNADAFVQLGLMPPPRSGGERWMTRLANLQRRLRRS
jgi:steroid delta-isomerase-like uncharacterized protein